MIHKVPEPKLEPSHTLDEYLYSDEYDDGADFIQPPEEDGWDEELILDIYRWLIGLGQ